MEQIGDLLKLERIKAKMSQEDVAKKIGVTQAAISTIESNISFRVETVTAYANLLGLELEIKLKRNGKDL